MNALIWVCLALVAWPSVFGLYYEKIKAVFQPPPPGLKNDSYFGYSIAYDSSYKKLVISAPKADNIGDVYDCDLDSKSCSKIDKTNITRGDELQNYTHDFLFGATVKAGPNFVMMCAPRYTEHVRPLSKPIPKKKTEGFDAIVTRGRCYTHSNGYLKENRFIEDEDRLSDSPSPMEATMDSFGWSIDVASDDSVIVGGPGMFHGRAMIYKQLADYVFPYLISKHIETPEFNFGYAVATGTFINDQLTYAISSTYGKFGSGEVSFIKKHFGEYVHVRKLDAADSKKELPAVGSMFGAVLCAAKMFGKRTDLLVGAPAYATKDPLTYNKGAVYVYLARVFKQMTYHRIIVGDIPGSMFGSAIINVGDLNKDKKDDIAIGAPFENSVQGVVYLYSGADIISDENSLKPLQKIKPEASYSQSFGMSLTPLLDYDNNGCNEIAIGSPYTDTVVVLRCMASVIVKTTATIPNLQGRTQSGKENFEFDVCLSVDYPTLPDKISATIITTVEMNHNHAKLAHTKDTGRYIFETTLDKNIPEYCTKVPFILPIDGKYDTPISYVISSELKTDPRNLTDFDSSRVLLSDVSDLNIRGVFEAAECAGKVCVPNLDITPQFSFNNADNPYIIGSSTTETLKFTLHNSGEVAYASCVKLHIVGVSVFQPGSCMFETSTDGDRLTCEPSKPIRKGQSMTSDVIDLEMNHLTNLDKSINITIILYNRCKDVATLNKTFEIPVKADPGGIVVKGETDIGPNVGMTEEEIKEHGKKLRHLYTINNNGPTNWKGLVVNVILPIQPHINYFNDDNSSVSCSLNTENTPCEYNTKDDTSMYFTCTVESLFPKLETATILVPINVLPGTLNGLLDEEKNITLTTSVKIELLDSKFRAESVSTMVILVKAPIPIDTIIIAVVVGLCILIIIALILYRIGFLQRKRREELQKLRKSVKRQTILRRSTMPSQNQQADDKRQILDQVNEEHEHEQAPNLI